MQQFILMGSWIILALAVYNVYCKLSLRKANKKFREDRYDILSTWRTNGRPVPEENIFYRSKMNEWMRLNVINFLIPVFPFDLHQNITVLMQDSEFEYQGEHEHTDYWIDILW